MGGQDIEAINTATEMLMLASQDFTQKLYEAASKEENQYMAGDNPTGQAPSDDDVVDAEIVDDGRAAVSQGDETEAAPAEVDRSRPGQPATPRPSRRSPARSSTTG